MWLLEIRTSHYGLILFLEVVRLGAQMSSRLLRHSRQFLVLMKWSSRAGQRATSGYCAGSGRRRPGDAGPTRRSSPVATVVADRVRLAVTDAGPGLDPAVRERVFERFYRGPAARRGEGSGLGLAIARAAATAMGGTLTVEPGRAGGTAFVLELPRG